MMSAIPNFVVNPAVLIRKLISRSWVLLDAIGISLILHLFWISVTTVVVFPPKQAPISYSKVSFLGPLLQQGSFEVRIGSRVPSLLEQRYLKDVQRLVWPQQMALSGAVPKDQVMRSSFTFADDGELIGLIEDSVRGPKLEPASSDQ